MSLFTDTTCYVNVAYLLADYLTGATGIRQTSAICGGSYVTRLARSLGILTPEAVEGLTLMENLHTGRIDETVLRNMRLIPKSTEPLRLLTSHPLRQPPAAQPPPSTAHPDTSAGPSSAHPDPSASPRTAHPDPSAGPSSAPPHASTTPPPPPAPLSLSFGASFSDPAVVYALLADQAAIRCGVAALLAAAHLPPLPPPTYILQPLHQPQPPPPTATHPPPEPQDPPHAAESDRSVDTDTLFDLIDSYQTEELLQEQPITPTATSLGPSARLPIRHHYSRARRASSAQPSPTVERQDSPPS